MRQAAADWPSASDAPVSFSATPVPPLRARPTASANARLAPKNAPRRHITDNRALGGFRRPPTGMGCRRTSALSGDGISHSSKRSATLTRTAPGHALLSVELSPPPPINRMSLEHPLSASPQDESEHPLSNDQSLSAHRKNSSLTCASRVTSLVAYPHGEVMSSYFLVRCAAHQHENRCGITTSGNHTSSSRHAECARSASHCLGTHVLDRSLL